MSGHRATTAPSGSPLVEEHRLLGVREGASPAEVRAAYRRTARAVHPDRCHSLGPDAVARATARFQDVERAFRLVLAAAERRPTATVVDGVYRPRHEPAGAAYAGWRAAGVRFDTAA